MKSKIVLVVHFQLKIQQHIPLGKAIVPQTNVLTSFETIKFYKLFWRDQFGCKLMEGSLSNGRDIGNCFRMGNCLNVSGSSCQILNKDFHFL